MVGSVLVQMAKNITHTILKQNARAECCVLPRKITTIKLAISALLIHPKTAYGVTTINGNISIDSICDNLKLLLFTSVPHGKRKLSPRARTHRADKRKFAQDNFSHVY